MALLKHPALVQGLMADQARKWGLVFTYRDGSWRVGPKDLAEKHGDWLRRHKPILEATLDAELASGWDADRGTNLLDAVVIATKDIDLSNRDGMANAMLRQFDDVYEGRDWSRMVRLVQQISDYAQRTEVRRAS